MILAFCAGTGRTGKTVIATELEKLGWKRYQSPTRAFFKSLGINGEPDLLSRPQQERAKIQRDYFEVFMEDLYKQTENFNPDVKMIFERAPIDNFAYMVFHDWAMRANEYDTYINRIGKFFEDVHQRGWIPTILMFPFPTEWMLANKDTDPDRASLFGKDMTIHALVQHITMTVYDNVVNETSICTLEDTSVRKRVAHILDFVAQVQLFGAVNRTRNIPTPQ